MTGNGSRPSAASFLRDRANLLTLAGLSCGVLAIYFSARGATTAAVIALLWALFCDWFDGPLARRIPDRTDADRAFGGQLDSLADIVSSGVGPAALLLSVGNFEPWFLPGAMALVVAGAVRLAHFNLFGHDGGASYTGLPIDTNIIVVAGLYAFREPVGVVVFPWLFYGTVVLLALLNLARFRTPKLTGGWYVVLAAYVVGMTLFYARML